MLNMQTTPKDLTDTQLGEAFEQAGNRVNDLYMQGADTTEADAEFERLYALLTARGLV